MKPLPLRLSEIHTDYQIFIGQFWSMKNFQEQIEQQLAAIHDEKRYEMSVQTEHQKLELMKSVFWIIWCIFESYDTFFLIYH